MVISGNVNILLHLVTFQFTAILKFQCQKLATSISHLPQVQKKLEPEEIYGPLKSMPI